MSRNHAVVVGGSMVGLCAARVLSRHFDHVTVLDRDVLPTGTPERAGVPQGRHVHALLVRGRRELNHLFPDFDKLMLERGAHEIDFGNDFATLRTWGWEPRTPTGLSTLFASRGLIESTVRELLLEHTNVSFSERTAVTGLGVSQHAPRRIDRVHVVPREAGDPDVLEADLVVDTSGRTSKAPEWLSALGFRTPRETVVDAHAGYSSRWYRAPAPEGRPREWWWKGIWLDSKLPRDPVGGVLFPVERDRWIVTLAGFAKHYPPRGEANFDTAIGRLRSPVLADAVRCAEPISPVYANRQMANRWRHYEKLADPLDGFVALGDSVCAFNPVYGQGMTTGVLSATILDECLGTQPAGRPGLSRAFFAAQARIQAGAWGLATGADFSVPGTEGKRPLGFLLSGLYLGALLKVSIEDAHLHRCVGEVLQMIEPPSSLFAPALAGRVARGTLRRWMRGTSHRRPIPDLPPVPAEPSPVR